MHAYAATRARWIESVLDRSDPLIARELVLDAVADTFTGVVAWDPNKAELAAHLCCVIRSRTAHDIARATANTMRSLNDDATDETLERETSHAMAARNDSVADSDAVERAAAVLEALRRRAHDDAEILRLLDAFETGAVDRKAVIAMTGMPAASYHNARRRLARIAAQLPDDLKFKEIDCRRGTGS